MDELGCRNTPLGSRRLALGGFVLLLWTREVGRSGTT